MEPQRSWIVKTILIKKKSHPLGLLSANTRLGNSHPSRMYKDAQGSWWIASANAVFSQVLQHHIFLVSCLLLWLPVSFVSSLMLPLCQNLKSSVSSFLLLILFPFMISCFNYYLEHKPKCPWGQAGNVNEWHTGIKPAFARNTIICHSFLLNGDKNS